MSNNTRTRTPIRVKVDPARADLFDRLRTHGTDVTHLTSVPNEGLESMLVSLDAAKVSVDAAKADAVKARKEASQAPSVATEKGKAFKYSQSARRLQRMLDRSRLDSTDSDQMASAIILDPSAKSHTTLDGKASSGYGNAVKATLRVLYHMDLLSQDYRDELKSIMEQGA